MVLDYEFSFDRMSALTVSARNSVYKHITYGGKINLRI